MRRGATGTRFIVDEAATIGVLMAADHTGQHERGIERMNRLLGLPDGRVRFDRHIVAHDPGDLLRLVEIVEPERLRNAKGRLVARETSSTMLILSLDGDVGPIEETRRFDAETTITCAWDDEGFAIRAWDDAGRAELVALEHAFRTGDAAVWMSGATRANPFEKDGLAVTRRSMTANALIESYDAQVDDDLKLAAAALQTGIVERIRAKPMRTRLDIPYYALRPAWNAGRRETAHPVVFFLNPGDQDLNNFGWFTVEELDQWIAGEGPIPKR